ncbi:hypothetical protein HDK64DRAFT_276111 [Phyllosticta capitalensis]
MAGGAERVLIQGRRRTHALMADRHRGPRDRDRILVWSSLLICSFFFSLSPSLHRAVVFSSFFFLLPCCVFCSSYMQDFSLLFSPPPRPSRVVCFTAGFEHQSGLQVLDVNARSMQPLRGTV